MEPIRKIVVGVDLSPPSEVAVGQAMGVARRTGAELILMTVEPEPDAAELVPRSLATSEERRRAVEHSRFDADRAEVEVMRQRLVGQGVEVSHVVAEGAVDSGLADGAARLGADLLVIGTHGHTGMRRLLLGSVAEKTVRLAKASVLVARGAAAAADGGFKNIVVGSDFSPLAERALERAVAMAAPGAVIEVVHAWQVPPDLSPDGTMAPALADLRESLAADTGKAGEELKAAWRARGVHVELHATEARPREALCDRAEAVGADLIVVGSHGRRGLTRLVLGSVAEATVRHAPCSVLVAR